MTSLISSAFLDEQSTKIRARPVPWEGYRRADLITQEELDLLKKVDRQSKSKIESVLLGDGQTYALLYLRLMKKLPRVDTTQYLIVLISEALTDHDERVPQYLNTSDVDADFPFEPLLKALDNSDEFVQLSAARILAVLMTARPTIPPKVLDRYFGAISKFLNPDSSSENQLDLSVQCLESILARPEVRTTVWKKTDIISSLVNFLKNKPSAQMSYQIIFCFWLLTFDLTVAQQINSKYDIIPLLVDIAQGAVKEKVIRITLATFRNLVSKAPGENLASMLVAKLLPYVRSLGTRKLSDEEVIGDAEYLKEVLSEKFESLTTYDEYVSELQSGHLSWTPVHSSESFWKENVTRLNGNDYELLKLLVALLKASNDPVVLAVAAHDIGQYVKHYDRGKRILTDMGAKARVMELMIHGSPDVRYHALTSVQKLVSNPWVSA